MAVSRSLRRLLRVLTLEEDQRKLVLESAIVELRRFERAMANTREQERRGGQLVLASARTGELPDRLAGLEETRAARRRAAALAPGIANAQREVLARRQAYLDKRVERRQVETLIGESEAKEAVVAGRRNQQAADDWYLNRLRTAKARPLPKKLLIQAESGDAEALTGDAEALAGQT